MGTRDERRLAASTASPLGSSGDQCFEQGPSSSTSPSNIRAESVHHQAGHMLVRGAEKSSTAGCAGIERGNEQRLLDEATRGSTPSLGASRSAPGRPSGHQGENMLSEPAVGRTTQWGTAVRRGHPALVLGGRVRRLSIRRPAWGATTLRSAQSPSCSTCGTIDSSAASKRAAFPAWADRRPRHLVLG